MARPITVTVSGLDALHHRLDAKNFFGPIRTHIVEGAAKAADKTMRRAAKGQAGKGTLSRAVRTEFGHRGLVAYVGFFGPGHGLVSSLANVARTINYGRRPGRRPPYKKLRLWAERAGIATPVRELQEAIKVHGTRGLHFLQAGENVANEVIRTGIRKSEAEIRALWNRPR